MARWFVRLGALYIVLAMGLGLLMLAWPFARGLAPAHAHVALLGGGALLIAGLVYQSPAHRPRRAGVALHLVLANLGLWGLAAYLGASAYLALPELTILGVTAGVLNLAAWLVFAVNFWLARD